MNRMKLAVVAAFVAMTAGCSADSILPVSSTPGSPRLDVVSGSVAGSIRTTFVPPDSCAGGSATNCNSYHEKDDVYLTGGPQNLEAGTYFFKVTSPDGSVLLSSDPIANRTFTVDASGNFMYTGGTHGVSPLNGHDRIQLSPYDDTPNNGGVYKTWACLYVEGSTDDQTSGCKTDNFQVLASVCETDCGEVDIDAILTVLKFYDANRDGVQQGGEAILEGWKFSVAPLLDISFDAFTTYSEEHADDTYVIEEYKPDQSNWFASTATSFNVVHTENNPASVAFGNYCTVNANARTIGFWGNKNGQAQIGDNPGGFNELVDLSNAFFLRNAAGTRVQFTAAQYSQFNTFLKNATATNMQYMLSAQLAATWLSWEAYGPYDFYVPVSDVIPTPGGVMLLSELFTRAATLLNVPGTLVIGANHPDRAYAEALKNAFDYVNNQNAVTPLVACNYSFNAVPSGRF